MWRAVLLTRKSMPHIIIRSITDNCVALLFIALCAAGCSSSDPGADEPAGNWATGSWGPRGVGPAAVGECCTVRLSIIQDGSRISGSGSIVEPGLQIGSTRTIAVSAEGTISDTRFSLTLSGPLNSTGSLTGTFYDGTAFVHTDARLVGFGISATVPMWIVPD